MEKISGLTKKMTEILSVVLFGAITVVVLLQVFSRFVLHHALPWPEEAVRFMLIWGAHLSFNILIIENRNINVAFFKDKIPAKINAYLDIVLLGLQTIFLGMLIWYGFAYARIGLISRSPAMGLPMIIPYLAVPIGGIFAFFQVIVKMRSRMLLFGAMKGDQ